jgi:hypothetical protein
MTPMLGAEMEQVGQSSPQSSPQACRIMPVMRPASLAGGKSLKDGENARDSSQGCGGLGVGAMT